MEMLDLKDDDVDFTHGILSQPQRILLGKAMLDPIQLFLIMFDQVVVAIDADSKFLCQTYVSGLISVIPRFFFERTDFALLTSLYATTLVSRKHWVLPEWGFVD